MFFGGMVLVLNTDCAIVCCSNGMKLSEQEKIIKLKKRLEDMFGRVITDNYIYSRENTVSSASAEVRAARLTYLFDSGVAYIFDISGGDISNEILPFLDYDTIKNSESVFCGYSDLTTVINAIYSKTGRASILFQARNIAGSCGDIQQKRLFDYVHRKNNELFDIKYQMLNGDGMSGIVVGGNIRCFLKLAGTEYFPNLCGKILLLEAFGGDEAKIRTYLAQLKQLGAFEKINGIILGTFTSMEKASAIPAVEELVLETAQNRLPVAKTYEIGHGSDSKAIFIGKEINLQS